MPTLEEFDPSKAVRHWMALKQRKPRVGDKVQHQEWYIGVFRSATYRISKPSEIKF